MAMLFFSMNRGSDQSCRKMKINKHRAALVENMLQAAKKQINSFCTGNYSCGPLYFHMFLSAGKEFHCDSSQSIS